MEDVINNFYGDGVELVSWYQDDGHHSDLADYNSDPLAMLIVEEEEHEVH